MSRPHLLLAEDEPNLRRVLAARLRRDGFEVMAVESGTEALQALQRHHFDAVLTDLRMPGADGMEVLRGALERDRSLPVVILTAHGTVDLAVEALKRGAFDFLTKPFDREELRAVLQKATATRRLSAREPGPQAPGRFGLVGESRPMQRVFEAVERVADTPATVLVTGESGTGKELVARALHEHSGRRDRPFVRVHCAAIPPGLLESELFGHEKGAFTGAVSARPGRFELADGGTLFLDEIGEVPLEMQAKLLRVLQEQEFERVGGVHTLRVDVRLVAATHRDLQQEVQQGRFREDLYYRLNVVRLHLPPLRERLEDIPLLVEHLTAKHARRLGRPAPTWTAEAMDRLRAYRWPCNVRELENVVERALLFCEGERVAEAHLPEELRGEGGGDAESPSSAPLPSLSELLDGEPEGRGLKEVVREAKARLEREIIAQALERTGGNVTHAARLLKLSRKGLQLKMRELGLRDEASE